jgi:hypothetical protein
LDGEATTTRLPGVTPANEGLAANSDCGNCGVAMLVGVVATSGLASRDCNIGEAALATVETEEVVAAVVDETAASVGVRSLRWGDRDPPGGTTVTAGAAGDGGAGRGGRWRRFGSVLTGDRSSSASEDE